MTKNLATIVATVDLEGADAHQVGNEIRAVLQRLGARLAPCGWTPDPDVIADATGVSTVSILDLNS